MCEEVTSRLRDNLVSIFQTISNVLASAFSKQAREELMAQINGIKDTIANILKDPVKAVSDEVRKIFEQFKNMADQKGGWYTAGYVVGTVTIALALAYVGAKGAQALTEALKGTKIGQAMAKTASKVKGKVKEAVGKVAPVAINGLKIVNGKVLGLIPLAEYKKYAKRSLHNIKAKSLMLGRYFSESDNYIKKVGKTSMYFDMGDDWEVIKKKHKLNDTQMFDLFNKPAIDKAVKEEKEILFSHDARLKKYEKSALADEWKYLKSKYGYRELEKRSDGTWIAVK